MALTSGSRVGVYQVVDLVGVGGMGEVYRARDTRLDRPAALKTLPDEFARDPERLARFEREARTLAQLNHPHIASIYGLEAGASPALVMEMVEGDTLAQRIAAGPIPLDEALTIAKQIAEALEHAHGLGIVHRDLKPANVKVGARDGPPKVKVLDFGLAKAMLTDAVSGSTPSAVSSPTITSPANMTRAGVILGTAAYMAPEQARGKLVDQRADIWAFGCVLFEMITGRRAFPGDEMPDVLARVIQSEPDWKLIPASTPHPLVTLLHRCLRKDPARRIHSIADVRIDLDDVAAGALDAGVPPADATSAGGVWRIALPAAALGAIVAAAATWAIASAPPPTQPAPVRRFGLPLPAGLTLHRDPTQRPNLALSPDDETLAVVLRDRAGLPRAYLRRFDDAAFQVVPGSDDTLRVFWSPDGTRLGLTTGFQVRSVDRSGVNSQSLFTMPATPQPPFWAANGDIVLAATGQPMHRWSPGGQPAPIARTPSGQSMSTAPFPLGEGRRLLYVEGRGAGRGAIMMRDGDQPPRMVVEVESTRVPSVQYWDGFLLIAHSAGNQSVITAQRFDPASGELSDRRVTLTTNASLLFTASSSALVFAHAPSPVERFYWVDERGATLSSLEGDISIFNFDLSADGRMVVLEQVPSGLSVRDLTRGVTSSLSAEGVDPVWSRDGSQVAYAVIGKRTVHLISPFGGQARQIYQADAPVYLDDWSRDGRWLAGHTNASGSGLLIPVGHDAKPIPFLHDGSGVDETRFSPDGRWLAYGVTGMAGQSQVVGYAGQSQVFLIDVPPTGRRWQLSVNGGAQPRWRDDGKALFFLSMTGAMMMVDVTLAAGSPPRFSAPRALFDTQLEVLTNVDQFAVSKDGTRFLLRRPVDLRTQDDPQVILNWQTLLKKDGSLSLDPWLAAELPEPPRPRGLEWLGVVGPGVIILGLSIGSGEFILGPAVFVRHGLSLLWVVVVAVALQTIFNLEVMRYTLATGEPIFTGFMRTRPSSTFWAVVYAGLYLLQSGWPAFAATAAAAVFFLAAGRLPGGGDAGTIYDIGAGLFLGCVAILSFGRRIVRTLEVLNWTIVAATLGGLSLMAIAFVPAARWIEGLAGLAGYDAARGGFSLMPAGADLILLAALVAYSGAGGMTNLVLSNWARDKGYGMAARAGYISAAVGGTRVHLAHTGFVFAESTEAMRRWRGWERIVRADQCGVFAVGAILGTLLPAVLYVTFIPRGSDIQGLGISAALASAVAAQSGAWLGTAVALLGAWILFKTQLDNFEGMVRAITDILWTGSARLRGWRGGDVRRVYYSVMAVLVSWAIVALGLAQPIVLLKLGANVAAVVFVITSLHLLYVNTRLLPAHVRPPFWRRLALVAMALFYGTFAALSLNAAF